MSRSLFKCLECRHVLGYRHHSGKLHVARETVAHLVLSDPRGPHVRLICPTCGRSRVFFGETVIVHAE